MFMRACLKMQWSDIDIPSKYVKVTSKHIDTLLSVLFLQNVYLPHCTNWSPYCRQCRPGIDTGSQNQIKNRTYLVRIYAVSFTTIASTKLWALCENSKFEINDKHVILMVEMRFRNRLFTEKSCIFIFKVSEWLQNIECVDNFNHQIVLNSFVCFQI